MQYAFNDRDNLYLVMDLLAGGDLRYHIGRVHRFTEEQTKFLVGCIITAIQYIHKMKIFHRDIKPQNLVFDEHGYLKLTDFGIARIDSPTQNLDASGTPGYMAPEVLCKQVHSYPVDFYAIGVITY